MLSVIQGGKKPGFSTTTKTHLGYLGLMGFFLLVLWFLLGGGGFFGILWDFLGFFFSCFSFYFINLNSDKNKFSTPDSYFKSALKYSRSIQVSTR